MRNSATVQTPIFTPSPNVSKWQQGHENSQVTQNSSVTFMGSLKENTTCNNQFDHTNKSAQVFVPTCSNLATSVPDSHTTHMNASKCEYLVPPADKPRARLSSGELSDEIYSDCSGSTDMSSDPSLKSTNKNCQEQKKFVKEYKLKQKTEICKNWEMYGKCKWQEKCSYAHGKHELVKKSHLPSNFMTKACEQFHKEKFCAYGKRCQFMHSERDIHDNQLFSTVLRENARLAKTKMDRVVGEPGSTQVYINVFSCKQRLSCFCGITTEDNEEISDRQQQEIISRNSGTDNNKLYEDFNDINMQVVVKKKKSGKGNKNKKMSLNKAQIHESKKNQVPKNKNFDEQFNDSINNSLKISSSKNKCAQGNSQTCFQPSVLNQQLITT